MQRNCSVMQGPTSALQQYQFIFVALMVATISTSASHGSLLWDALSLLIFLSIIQFWTSIIGAWISNVLEILQKNIWYPKIFKTSLIRFMDIQKLIYGYLINRFWIYNIGYLTTINGFYGHPYRILDKWVFNTQLEIMISIIWLFSKIRIVIIHKSNYGYTTVKMDIH